ncbi:glutaredoxin 3-like protein [Rhizopus microsporus ATCC 52813]|uniref:Glutaredoxin 3-like protein n=2 Tax=Rhizopus microsporus TaxID=58291 RepID=A0A2G4T9P6_RHIZD|nr:glutaredoxin 3-like protein [Rhizopus microsporus ATCC 52813]PHZ17436.1 glutaredoxin 3-like protein [Rhizopus microsporus ATCC 52813]
MSNLIEIRSEAQFQELVQKKDLVFILNFWAPWAEPCQQMNDVFAELSGKFPALQFLKIEAEENPDISESFEISAVPTFIILKGGKVVEQVEGAKAAELSNAVAKHAKGVLNKFVTTPAASADSEAKPVKDLNSRLKALINSAPVMIFIKGTPQQPRCGFSRQLVELLAEQKVKYSSFNILADEDVRQGLKAYSDWPTYPQVYVNGELIGGLDIVKEMVASGEFQEMLPKEKDLSTRLQELIEKQPVMVFIKGTPEEPRCGFSRQMVALLNDRHVKYGYFDILTDDEVRQGLKTHVNWPTFPMLFYKGELLGGLDIIKEMIESGEFDQVITA